MDTVEDFALYLKLGLAYSWLLWTTLYLVKASFLALCYSVFGISDGFRKAWWTVLIFTFLTYWPIMLLELWHCGSPSNYANPAVCQEYFAPDTGINSIAPAVDAALHAASDCFILTLPLVFISKLQMSRAHKVGMAAVFAVVVTDIVMGIIRNISVLYFYQGDYADVQVVMTVFEPGLAVIVCALPAYRGLLSRASVRKKPSIELQRMGGTIGTAPHHVPFLFESSGTENNVREPESAHIL